MMAHVPDSARENREPVHYDTCAELSLASSDDDTDACLCLGQKGNGHYPGPFPKSG